MKWRKTTATLFLDARDIAIINQCGHGVGELINKKAAKRVVIIVTHDKEDAQRLGAREIALI